jgi:hypothetical protein
MIDAMGSSSLGMNNDEPFMWPKTTERQVPNTEQALHMRSDAMHCAKSRCPKRPINAVNTRQFGSNHP